MKEDRHITMLILFFDICDYRFSLPNTIVLIEKFGNQ